MQTCDDVYGKMYDENSLKNGALEIDFSTTELPLFILVVLRNFCPVGPWLKS